MRWGDFDDYEKLEEEIERREKVARENPKDANAYYELGVAYEYVHDWARAKECADKAIELEPKNILFQAFLAFVSMYTEDHQDAVDAISTLIELGADSGDYYVELACSVADGIDEELIWHRIEELRNAGKEQVAKKLEEWVINPV